MDEAMHPLTILAVGLYGKTLMNQNGAPIRLVVPVEVRIQEHQVDRADPIRRQQPATAWKQSEPQEYGFYSNVNREVDHPRWSQATRAAHPGYVQDRKTLMFNGYGDQVASLYAGMDLRKNY